MIFLFKSGATTPGMVFSVTKYHLELHCAIINFVLAYGSRFSPAKVKVVV